MDIDLSLSLGLDLGLGLVFIFYFILCYNMYICIYIINNKYKYGN